MAKEWSQFTEKTSLAPTDYLVGLNPSAASNEQNVKLPSSALREYADIVLLNDNVTITADDLGKLFYCGNDEAIVITLPITLPKKFWCDFYRENSGAVSFISPSGSIACDTPAISDQYGLVRAIKVTDESQWMLGKSDVLSSVQSQLDSKLSKSLTSGHIFLGSGANVATDIAMSGDVTLNGGAMATVNNVPQGATVRGNGSNLKLPTLIYSSAVSSFASNTTSETSLRGVSWVGTYTLPANRLALGSVININASGYYSTNSGSNSLVWKVYIGGTALLVTASTLMPASTSNRAWSIAAQIVCRNAGDSGSVIGQGKVILNISEGTGDFATQMVNTTTSTVNTTVTQDINLTAQWDVANSNNQLVCTNFTIEVQN